MIADPEILELGAKLIEQLRLIAPIPDSEIEHLLNVIKVERVNKGWKLAVAGEPTTKIGFVLRGVLKIYFLDRKGKTYVKALASEGEFVSEYACIVQKEPSQSNIEALEDNSIVAIIEYDEYIQLLSRHSAWQRLAHRGLEKQLVLQSKREYQLLALDAKARYRAFLHDQRHLLQRVPRYEIAAYLGISAVFLSKISGNKTNKSTSSR